MAKAIHKLYSMAITHTKGSGGMNTSGSTTMHCVSGKGGREAGTGWGRMGVA